MSIFSRNNKRGRPPQKKAEPKTFDRVEERRKLYAWLTLKRRPNETDKDWNLRKREGKIDPDICDGIGQLHALGYLDGHDIEPMDLRDRGREWRDLYCKWLRGSGMVGGGFDPKMDGTRTLDAFYADALTDNEHARLERLELELGSFEKSVLLSLLVDPMVGTFPCGKQNSPWVESHIALGLLERHKVIPVWMQPVRFPDANDKELLKAAIRGLCQLYDGSLPARFERRAA